MSAPCSDFDVQRFKAVPLQNEGFADALVYFLGPLFALS